MPTRESNAFARLKDRVCRPEDRFERIENGMGSGMPDVNYCMTGSEGWIEIKAPIIPARETSGLLCNNHTLGVDQANWFLAQYRAKGRAFLFIATERVLLLLHGGTVGREGIALNKMTLTQLLDLAMWQYTVAKPNQEAWWELRSVLTK